MNVLLIANGPAALSKEMGKEIDSFHGDIVRFNNYSIKGYEKYVGTRTDIWITTIPFPNLAQDTHKKRYYIHSQPTENTFNDLKVLDAELWTTERFKKAKDKMGFNVPSSGVIATTFFLEKGYKVWIYGFDYLCSRRPHHYNKDDFPRGENHSGYAEWLFFNSLNDQGEVHFFGLTENETTPIYRVPVPCGRDDDVAWYREPAHSAWYEWFATMVKGKIVLDVGCGVGAGVKILQKTAAKVDGIDVDERLRSVYSEIIVGDLDNIPDKSYDCITCVDVIEHVVEDRKFFNNLRRVAREKIFFTTPNYYRSECGNVAHCREYTIPQFMNLFRPREVWSASPDGKVHLTKLLERLGDWIIDFSCEGADNSIRCTKYAAYLGKVPLETRFNNTVDKNEWAHICAICY